MIIRVLQQTKYLFINNTLLKTNDMLLNDNGNHKIHLTWSNTLS